MKKDHNLRVCWRCKMAIESREGRQLWLEIPVNVDENPQCEWCEETADDGGFDTLFEIQ